MKTVKDYLDLGLVFVGDDELLSETNNKDSKGIIMSRCWLAHNRYDGFLEVADGFFSAKEWIPSSFAWRNNDGVKPEYKGKIEVCLNNAIELSSTRADWSLWELGYLNSVARWRPVVLQSESPTVSPKEGKAMNPSREPKAIFNTESTMFGDRLRRAAEVFESGDLDMSISDGKPVYTAEMHAKNELPQVGVEVKVCIVEAGFVLDGNDSKFEGKTVTVKAAFINKDENKVVAIENEKGNCACYIIECIKPIIKTIKVNGFDVPAPMSENIKAGDKYFFPAPAIERYFQHTYWDGGDFDKLNLARGTIHKTQESAIAHAKAMLGIDPNKDEK